MKFKVITLFPDFVKTLENYSIIGRAIKDSKISLETQNLRDFGLGAHRQVDDRPYGGGAGMLMRVDVVVPAIEKALKRASKKHSVILLSPDGKRLKQEKVEKLAQLDELILVCGHYEGFDRRIEEYMDEKISVGDFVVSGGELPALLIIDAVSRLLPGVLGKDESSKTESFSKVGGRRVLEFPQYTRPEKYKGKAVPKVLLSGNHKEIEEWRKGKLI